MQVHRDDEIGAEDIELMAPERIVISPEPCTPNEADISLDAVHRFGSHSPVAARDTLPDCLEVTAWTALPDDSPNEIMGLRHREHPVQGV